MPVKKITKKVKIYHAKDRDGDEPELQKEKESEQIEYPRSNKLNKIFFIIYSIIITGILVYFLLAYLEVLPLAFPDLDLTLNIVTLFMLSIMLMIILEAIEMIVKASEMIETKRLPVSIMTDGNKAVSLISIISLIGITICFILTALEVIPPITIYPDLEIGLGKTLFEALISSLVILGIIYGIMISFVSSIATLRRSK